MKTVRKEVDSKVNAVTVYQGRAMISRATEVDLEAGHHVLVFVDLPAALERDSIQVKGKGEATLGECIFETEYFMEDVDEKKRALRKTKQALEERLAELEADIHACDNQKAFIEKIAGYVTSPSLMLPGEASVMATTEKNRLNVTVWEKMVAFYHAQQDEISRKRLETAKALRDQHKKLEKNQAELDALGHGRELSRNIIKVSLLKQGAGKISLELSYMISGPTWRPVYNVRTTSDSDMIDIEYDALVNQGTGEYWEGIALKLSTARVNVSGAIPELRPWRLEFYQPPVRSLPQAKPIKARAEQGDPLSEMADAEMPMAAAAPEPEITGDQAEITGEGTSVVFSVAGGGHISGDNSDTRVTIMRSEFPAEFIYTTIPKLAEYAYLTAKITNISEFPLLPGKTNIFFDGSFVSGSAIKLVMPDQKIKLSLGVDEGVKVEYRFLKQFKKNQRLMTKRIMEQFEYQIRITNNRGKPIEINVFDQFPISQHKDITVKMLSLDMKDNQREITLDDESKIKWNFKLPAGEKRELPFSFLVEYPTGSQVSGLYS